MSSTSLDGIIGGNRERDGSSLETTPTTTTVTTVALTESTSKTGSNNSTDGTSWATNKLNVCVEDGIGKEKSAGEVVEHSDSYHCGWFGMRPRWIQQFLTPKWALFWLCWAGAVQGWYEL